MSKKQQEQDAKLVLSYQKGNKKALQILVKRWHKEFCNRAYWIVKDADVAKDIAQDCWTTIIIKIKNLKDPKHFKSWALRIIYTKSLDWVKVRAKQREHLKKYELELVDDKQAENTKLKTQLLVAIQNLSVHQQEVIKLFYVEAYSLKEISELLKISVGTAKSRLFHAREKLKLILKHKTYEDEF